ncbi:MAG: hypothetical protein OXC06_04070 [Acidimicrobiaceae bacterium]|nr:hypothetical protein [Acidimicrobiaceae bacterium]
MAVEKYVVLVEADGDVTASERDDAVVAPPDTGRGMFDPDDG